MYSQTDIIAKGWLVTEIVNLVLRPDQLEVDKIFLIGSYASGKQTEWSDIDFLIQLKGGKKIGQLYPSWKQQKEIHLKLNTSRVHVIFGTEQSAKSLHEKHKNNPKNYAYKELHLKEITHASTCTSNS